MSAFERVSNMLPMSTYFRIGSQRLTGVCSVKRPCSISCSHIYMPRSLHSTLAYIVLSLLARLHCCNVQQ